MLFTANKDLTLLATVLKMFPFNFDFCYLTHNYDLYCDGSFVPVETKATPYYLVNFNTLLSLFIEAISCSALSNS